jgi:hypothetical protein
MDKALGWLGEKGEVKGGGLLGQGMVQLADATRAVTIMVGERCISMVLMLIFIEVSSRLRLKLGWK